MSDAEPYKRAGKGTVVSLFDRIAPVYDRLNRIISWGRDQRWRRDLARCLDLKAGQVILDISAGTGDMEPALKGICPELEVIGLDPSRPMVSLYREKQPNAEIALGTVEKIPFRDASFARAVCTFGLRNFKDRSTGFKEVNRVLEPGGLWGFLEMSAPNGTLFPIIYALYFKHLVPLIGAALSPSPGAYRYLRDSVYAFPEYDLMVEEHYRAGFGPVYYRPILRGAVGLYIFKKTGIPST